MRSNKLNYLFFGIIAALGALLVEMILSVIFSREITTLTDQLTIALFLLVLTEESFKFAVILKAISPTAFLLPSFLISAGFAATEISLAYFKNAGTLPNDFFWLLAGVGAIHLTTGLIGGYGAFSFKKNGRIFIPFLLFFLAVSLHLIYNVAIIKLVKN